MAFRWCLILALLPVAACRGPRAEPPSRSDDGACAVMSFNIRYGTADDGPDHWRHRRALVFDVLQNHDPDLVGLQEALHFQLEAILAVAPHYHAIGVGRDDGQEAGEYAAILVRRDRFEVLDHGTFWLSKTPDVPGSTSFGNELPRICTWARLRDRPRARTFVVFNTHLDHVSQPSRERSIVMIHERLQAVTGDPAIVMGDLNIPLRNEALETLLAPGGPLHDALATTTGGTFHGFRGGDGGPRIDHILIDQRWRVRSAGVIRDHVVADERSRYPSDHNPVLARLVLERPP